MWTDEDSRLIRDTLLRVDPAFKDAIDAGYHYIQMPEQLSRFYMRETASYLKTHFSGPSILDYGCGVGTTMLYLWKNGLTRIEGRDANPRIVEAAHRVLEAFGAPLQVMGVTRDDVYAIRGCWDAVLMNDWLYFGVDLDRVAEGLRSNLTPNGLWAFDLLEFETPMKGGRSYYRQADVGPMLRRHGFVLTGSVTLDQGTSRKTLYFSRLEKPTSVLSPGGSPYV